MHQVCGGVVLCGPRTGFIVRGMRHGQEWQLTSQYIPGATNNVADALSRKQHAGISIHDAGCLTADSDPSDVWDLLVMERPNWTSASWRSKLRSLST